MAGEEKKQRVRWDVARIVVLVLLTSLVIAFSVSSYVVTIYDPGVGKFGTSFGTFFFVILLVATRSRDDNEPGVAASQVKDIESWIRAKVAVRASIGALVTIALIGALVWLGPLSLKQVSVDCRGAATTVSFEPWVSDSRREEACVSDGATTFTAWLPPFANKVSVLTSARCNYPQSSTKRPESVQGDRIVCPGLDPGHPVEERDRGNHWVRVEPLPTTDPAYSDIAEEPADSADIAFHRSDVLLVPTAPYGMQSHEVTWREILETQLSDDAKLVRWAANNVDRAHVDRPAIGVPYDVAEAYCRSVHGELPTEQQWVYAARGTAKQLGHSLSSAGSIHAFAGPNAEPVTVTENDADHTERVRLQTATNPREPFAPRAGLSADLYDLVGNAREWTSTVFTPPGNAQVPAGLVMMVVRGLPLRRASGGVAPHNFSAYREAVPVSCDSPGSVGCGDLADVGFRCVRSAQP